MSNIDTQMRVADIDCLELALLDIYNGDWTMKPQLRAIASALVLKKKNDVQSLLRKFQTKPNECRVFLDKLLACETDFMDIEPRCLGVDLVAYRTADKFQQSLDVKCAEKNSVKKNNRKIPSIKPNLLHSNNKYVWIRWFCANCQPKDFYIIEYRKYNHTLANLQCATGNIDGYTILAVNATYRLNRESRLFFGDNPRDDNECELLQMNIHQTFVKTNGDGYYNGTMSLDDLYFEHDPKVSFIVLIYHRVTVYEVSEASCVYESDIQKTTDRGDRIKIQALLSYYDSRSDCSIVFLSELIFLEYNPLLFISNYIKFMYCYMTSHLIFDPKEAQEWREALVYLCGSSLFLRSKNSSNMPPDTHGPLNAYTGERPKALLSTLSKQKDPYIFEGIRSMQSLDLMSDIGIRSNMIEVSGDLRKNNTLGSADNINDVFVNLSNIH